MIQKDVVIIGGGPSGLAASIFTSLDGWDTLILEANWVGGQAEIAYTVSNYPGFLPGDGEILVENMTKQVTASPPAGVGAELIQEKVVQINTQDKRVGTETEQYQAKAIIIATGSTMQRLNIKGEEKFIDKGVTYYAKRDAHKFNGKKVLVVGGGNTTAKSALVAKAAGANEVILIHRRDSLRAYPTMVRRLGKEGVEIKYTTEIEEIKGNGRVASVILKNNVTDEKNEIFIDWLVVCVGTEPDISLAREANLKIKGDFVSVDNEMMTNVQGIFACGEIIGTDRHIISSAASGAYAGMAVSKYLALDKVRKGEMFSGAINGKYADEYAAML